MFFIYDKLLNISRCFGFDDFPAISSVKINTCHLEGRVIANNVMGMLLLSHNSVCLKLTNPQINVPIGIINVFNIK